MNTRPMTHWNVKRERGYVYVEVNDGSHVVEVGPIFPEDAARFGLALVQVSILTEIQELGRDETT